MCMKDVHLQLLGSICLRRVLVVPAIDGEDMNVVRRVSKTGMGMAGGRYGRSALKDPAIPDPGLFEPDPYL